METKSNAKLKALFIIPSITGIILFMIPVKNADGDWTVVVKILADIISGYIGGFLPLLCVLILTVSAVMSVIALAKPKFIMNSDIMKECFACKPIWVVLRVLAVIFVWLTYLGVGEDGVGLIGMITGGGQGGGGVGHDQVHALGNKAVDDRAAVVGLAGGVLVFKLHLAGEGFIQSVDKTLGCSVQRGVLHQLADADLIGGALGGGIVRAGRGIVRAGGGCLRLGAAAGGKGQRHGRSQNKSEQFLFHSDLLLLSVSGRIHKVGCLPKNKGGSVHGTEPPRV